MKQESQTSEAPTQQATFLQKLFVLRVLLTDSNQFFNCLHGVSNHVQTELLNVKIVPFCKDEEHQEGAKLSTLLEMS